MLKGTENESIIISSRDLQTEKNGHCSYIVYFPNTIIYTLMFASCLFLAFLHLLILRVSKCTRVCMCEWLCVCVVVHVYMCCMITVHMCFGICF